MKMFKKIITALALVAFMQHAQGNIFTNLVKTIIGYGAAKVDQGIAYVDQFWFNVEQDLYKPMEQANSLYDALQSKKQNIALHGNNAGFPEKVTNKDEAKKAMTNLLYLMEQKKVAFADPKKSLHCFKTGTYAPADRIADTGDIQTLIANGLIELQAIENIVKPVLQKTYARNKDKRTLFELIRGHEDDNVFVQKKVDDIKSFLWGQLCDYNIVVIQKLMNAATQETTLNELFNAFDTAIAAEKDETKKKEIVAKKESHKKIVQHIQTVCVAYDMYMQLHKMTLFLRTLQSANIGAGFLQTVCVEYQSNVDIFDAIAQAQQKVNADNLVLFARKDEQFTHEMLTNRSVVIAKNMQEALINGQLIDAAGVKVKLFETNYKEVKKSIERLVTTALADVNSLKTAFEKLSYINRDTVVVPRGGTKTVKAHLEKTTLTKHKEYMDFATDLTKLMQKTVLQKDTPVYLLEKCTEDIKQYAELVSLKKRLELLKKMSDDTATITQIDALLTNDKKIDTEYTNFKKQKAIFDKNQSVAKLQLNDDINLDSLLSNRGSTFANLKQRLGVQSNCSWDVASAIVTAGENAYKAYTDLIASCNKILDLTGGFDFETLTNRSLKAHTHAIVAKAVAASKDGKEAVLADLNELNQAFVAAINKGNFTDQARTIIKEVADIYINSIKPALKAQVIAAWYTHDIAWKMENETIKGIKGSMLDGLRKLTPTCGKSVSLEVIS